MTEQQAQDASTETEAQDAEDAHDDSQDQPTGFDALPKETQAEIRKLRRENAGYRKRVKDFEDASRTDDERRDAALKDAESRADAAETRLRTANARSAVTDAATKANAISARAVFALIQSEIDYDDDGEPTNVPALIAAAKKDEPGLFRAAAGGGDGGKGKAPTDANDVNAALRSLRG